MCKAQDPILALQNKQLKYIKVGLSIAQQGPGFNLQHNTETEIDIAAKAV